MLAAAMMFLSELNVKFPSDGASWEQIMLRWIHVTAAILWIGSLYFHILVVVPMLMKSELAMRGKMALAIMPKAAWIMRWSAVVVWLVGFRYFMILAKTDALNAGDASLMWRWIGIWAACWVGAFVIFMGGVESGKLPAAALVLLAAIVTIAAAWINLALVAGPMTSNKTLCISVGGGIGTIMFLAVWGIVWRCQKKLIAWTRAAVEHGAAMPPEFPMVQKKLAVVSAIGAVLTLPVIFFMTAASHFPFLSGR
jgi:uncharacterized membrane protein